MHPLLTAVVALASCEEDIFDNGGKKLKFGENEVVVAIGGNTNGLATRSDAARTIVAPSTVIDLPKDEEDEMTISLVETVSSLDEPCYDAVMGTRGTPLYTENFYKHYASFVGYPYVSTDVASDATGTYGTSAALGDVWGGEDYTFELIAEPTTKGDPLIYKNCYGSNRWPEKTNGKNDGTLRFFFEAIPANHKDASGNDYVGPRSYNKNGSISFHYTSPANAVDQQDILFTSKDMTWADHNDEDNTVLFYHALTGVKFKLSESTDFESSGMSIAINSITIEGLANEGDCVVTPNYTDDNTSKKGNPSNKNGATETRSAACSQWSNKTTPANSEFKVTFEDIDEFNTNITTDEMEGYKDALTEFPDDFDLAYDDNTASRNLNDLAYSKTFMFIPQDVTGKTMVVEYTVTADGTQTTYKKRIALPEAEWKAGELRTFALSISRVLVAIDDDMKVNRRPDDQKAEDIWTVNPETGKKEKTTGIVGDTKYNLQTLNTGNATEYQRIIISANWVYTDKEGNDIIVRQHDLSKDVNFINAISATTTAGENQSWIIGDDGYFYYVNPIAPGNMPNVAVFEEYTCPDQAYFAGTHLVMDICVQAVQYNANATETKPTTYYFDHYWDEPKVNGTTTKISDLIKGHAVEVPRATN